MASPATGSPVQRPCQPRLQIRTSVKQVWFVDSQKKPTPLGAAFLTGPKKQPGGYFDASFLEAALQAAEGSELVEKLTPVRQTASGENPYPTT